MNKKTSFLIAGILAVLASLLFLVVRITETFIIAYVFVLIGIAGVLALTLVAEKRNKSYPWVLSLPVLAIKYLIVEAIISIIVVTIEQITSLALPLVYFVLIHIFVLAIYAIKMIALKQGVNYVENIDAKNQMRQQFIVSAKTETGFLLNKATDLQVKQLLSELLDKMRFSYPTTKDSVEAVETEILEKLENMKTLTDEDFISEIKDITILLDERNLKCELK